VLVSFAAPSISERSVRASTRSLIDGDLEQAREQAERARSWSPLAVEPLVALARVEQRDGNVAEAQRRYIDAVELQPENPETWYALGIFELEVRDDACSGYRFLNEAYTRDPAGRQWFPGGPLDVARDAVDAGACLPS
jgi:Flp pilus assembly protein TadD